MSQEPAPLAASFEPPYVAVIFTSELTSSAGEDYAATASRMEALAREQPGYLGFESVKQGAIGISISYWRDDASVLAWKREVEHAAAQHQARNAWYVRYQVRIARVERAYSFER